MSLLKLYGYKLLWPKRIMSKIVLFGFIMSKIETNTQNTTVIAPKKICPTAAKTF